MSIDLVFRALPKWPWHVYRCRVVRFFFATLFSLTVAASEPSGRRITLVTSFLPLYCWTVNIAGDLVGVQNLISAKSEPHDYAFSASDARRLAAANLIVVNGAGLESWLPRFVRSGSGGTQRPIVDVASTLSPWLMNSNGYINPHFWLNPVLAEVAVSNLCAALGRIDPIHAETYVRNASSYTETLRRLDREIEGDLRDVSRREIVTYHNAFAYFARRYNLSVVGVVEQVPEVNPSPKYLAALRRTMRDHRVKEIFIPANAVPRFAKQIARDFDVKLVPLDTLETGLPQRDAYELRLRQNGRVLRASLR